MRIWQMAALFMAALLICLLVLAPMSMIKTRAEAAVPGLRVKAADGTVWRGRLQGVSLKDERFGTIELRARPLSLLLLRLASGFKVSGSRFDAQGNAGVSLINGGWRLEQTTLEADLARANIRDPIPIRGRVTLTIDRMTGTKDQCADARGMASSNALEQSLGIIEWKGPVVEGPISCENGRVVLLLRGADKRASVEIRAKSKPGGFDIDVIVDPSEAELAEILGYAGFQKTDEGYAIAVSSS